MRSQELSTPATTTNRDISTIDKVSLDHIDTGNSLSYYNLTLHYHYRSVEFREQQSLLFILLGNTATKFTAPQRTELSHVFPQRADPQYPEDGAWSVVSTVVGSWSQVPTEDGFWFPQRTDFSHKTPQRIDPGPWSSFQLLVIPTRTFNL